MTTSKPSRPECPVLGCGRVMIRGAFMCAHCWAKVPLTLKLEVEQECHEHGHVSFGLFKRAFDAVGGALQ